MHNISEIEIPLMTIGTKFIIWKPFWLPVVPSFWYWKNLERDIWFCFDSEMKEERGRCNISDKQDNLK